MIDFKKIIIGQVSDQFSKAGIKNDMVTFFFDVEKNEVQTVATLNCERVFDENNNPTKIY